MLLAWTLWPILSFAAVTQQTLTQTVSPVLESDSTSTQKSKFFGDSKPGEIVDYTNANVWYPIRPQKKIVTPVNSYRLSIPKLHISFAPVIIAGDDLNKGLIHYGGTSLPGQYGNTVIFGHSTLPQFFNQTNYMSIFSTLPTLSPGDKIIVEYDGIQYTYMVYDMVVLEATDLSTLEQHYDDSYLTLVTCVPPGTYWKRLNVKAKLSKQYEK